MLQDTQVATWLRRSPKLERTRPTGPIGWLRELASTVYGSRCCKKVKVAHSRLPSVGFRSWSRFLAVSLQVTWVINPAAGSHYFPPGLQLPRKPLRQLLPILLLGEQSVSSLPETVTRQRRDCDLNPGPSAPESRTLTTRLPSHPVAVDEHNAMLPI